MMVSQKTCTSVLARFDDEVDTNGQRIGVVETNNSGQIIEVDWFYDEIGRLTREVSSSFGGDRDFQVEYQYDKVGNRLIKWIDDDGDGSCENRIQYDYDANDRMTQERLLLGDIPTGINTTVHEYGPGNAQTQQTKNTFRNGNNNAGSWLSQTTRTYGAHKGDIAFVTIT